MNFESDSTLNALQELVTVLRETVNSLSQQTPPEWLLDMQHATRASMVHDRVMAELARRFEDHPTIGVYEAGGLSFVRINGIHFRFHCTKDRSGRISINTTRQTKQWNSGIRLLPGLPDPNEHYHIVYIPDDTWTDIEKLLVGAYRGRVPVEVREIELDAGHLPISIQETWADQNSMPALKLKDRGTQQPLEGIENEDTA